MVNGRAKGTGGTRFSSGNDWSPQPGMHFLKMKNTNLKKKTKLRIIYIKTAVADNFETYECKNKYRNVTNKKATLSI